MNRHGTDLAYAAVCRCRSLRCAGTDALPRDDVAMLVLLSSGTARASIFNRRRYARSIDRLHAEAMTTIRDVLAARTAPERALVALELLEVIAQRRAPNWSRLSEWIAQLGAPMTDIERARARLYIAA